MQRLYRTCFVVPFPRISACLFSTVLLVCAADPTAGQDTLSLHLDPDLLISQYQHDSWQDADGLPQNSVYAITQSQDGYLWLGTQRGLVRFDGQTFTVFEQSQVDGLESNDIRALAEGRDGTLWIGTYGGGLTELRDGAFTTYTTEDGLASDVIFSLHEARDGTLWIGTIGGGVNRFDGSSFMHYTTEHGLPGNDVLAIEDDQEGRLWIGTQAGVARLQEDEFTRLTEDRLPGPLVRALHVDTHGTLWIGTDRGLARLRDGRLTTYSTEDGLSSDVITALYEDGQQTLWVGTLDGGIVRYHEGQFASFSADDGLTHNRVRTLYQDHEGSLWIGTEFGGLNRLRGSTFVNYSTTEGLSSDVVLSVMHDRQGALWMGTDGGGLNRLADGTLAHYGTRQGLASDFIFSLHEDRAGRLWVGTMDGGICRWSGETFSCLDTQDGLASNNVYAIFEDRQHHLWVGTDAGLNQLRDGQVRTYTTANGLSNDFITTMQEDASGALWVGTYGGGLNRFQNDTITSYTTDDGLTSNLVLTLYQDADGTLWIGTQEGGLCRFRDAQFSCFTSEDGLPRDNVLQILEDEQGYLWLGSLEGIVRVRKADLHAYADGHAAPIPTAVFTQQDGLRSDEMNGGVQPAAWKTPDGRLWFATMRGVASIDPSQLLVNTVPPPIVLERITVNGNTHPADEGVSLPPGSKNFEFHVAALSFIEPEHVQIRYRLDGYDDAWIDADNRRTAYYTNLPPGDYRFRVTAANSDGIWNERGASLAFHVQPFFYQTRWFYLLCIVGLALLVASAYRLRTRHLKARERTLKRRVRNQTQELREREQELAQLNEELATINQDLEQEVQRQLDEKLEARRRYEQELVEAKEKAESSARLKSSILANMSHEVRTPIASILGFAQILSEEVTDEQRTFVDYIQRNGQRLLDTLNSILDLSRIESDRMGFHLDTVDLRKPVQETIALLTPMAEQKDLDLHLEIPEYPLRAQADEGALDRVLYNLINNAVKFTDEGHIVVEVGRHNDDVYLRVRDTGIGISEEFFPHLFKEFEQESTGPARTYEGSGLGLAITQRLVEAMDGRIVVESQKGQGSVFTVYFPHVELAPTPEEA